jgi:hypothetical protein
MLSPITVFCDVTPCNFAHIYRTTWHYIQQNHDISIHRHEYLNPWLLSRENLMVLIPLRYDVISPNGDGNIQVVPGGNINILGGHSIRHSK